MSQRKEGQISISQQAQYEDLFNRLKDCIFLLNFESFEVLEVNFRCEQVFELASQEFVGKSIFEWIEPSEHAEFNKALRMAKRRYYPRTIQHRFLAPRSQAFDMEILICPLRVSHQTEVLQVIARDISFRREAERKIQQLLEELTLANHRLEQLNATDEMTGLNNYRHFKVLLQMEHDRASRYKTHYSLLFFDLDHFKKYNDRNGHPAGDRLLKLFSGILTKSCRTSDLASRYGGEEFVVICPSTPKEGAAVVAERVRAAFEHVESELSKFHPESIVTVSCGVASYPVDGTTPEAVLKAADEAVYYSKAHGRNQVTLAKKKK